MLLEHVAFNFRERFLLDDLLPVKPQNKRGMQVYTCKNGTDSVPSHIFYLNSSGRVPSSGQPESFAKASQVGESHECLEVLQQATFQTQKIDEGPHSLVDLAAKGDVAGNVLIFSS